MSLRIATRFAVVAAALLAGAGGPETRAQPAPRPELFDYIAAPEPAFEWRTRARYERGSTEIVELRLHSQTWRGMLWKHRLFLIRPESIATGENALLIVGGGRWSEADEAAEAPSALPEGASRFLEIAEAMETVVAVLGTVPFQPLFGRTEDELIAHTFERYLAEGDRDWPLLLPMTKSAVAAMDAVQAATESLWDQRTAGFTIVGGSKRGWTTWLAAVADERVNAIAPLVFDALSLAEHFPHQLAVWGNPSEEISPYTALDLHEVLSSEAGSSLRRIVDPYAYRETLTLPKLVINATNDEYFPIDSTNLYWGGLEQPKHLVYVANEPHSIDELELVIPSINALHRTASAGTRLPELAWEYAPTGSGLELCIRADPAPVEVLYWRAESPDRDFRNARFRAAAAETRGPGHVLDLSRPESGYAAVYADLTFENGIAPYYLSTTVAIMNAAADEPVSPDPADNGEVCTQANETGTR